MDEKIYREALHEYLEKLKGFTVAEVLTETNASAEGIFVRFEKEIVGGTICVDFVYDNEDEVKCQISNEYLKQN